MAQKRKRDDPDRRPAPECSTYLLRDEENIVGMESYWPIDDVTCLILTEHDNGKITLSIERDS